MKNIKFLLGLVESLLKFPNIRRDWDTLIDFECWGYRVNCALTETKLLDGAIDQSCFFFYFLQNIFVE